MSKGRHQHTDLSYKLIDTIHYAQLNLPAITRGIASIHRTHWIRLFYRKLDGRRVVQVDLNSENEHRSKERRQWERFKSAVRTLGLAVELDPHVEMPGEFHALARPEDNGKSILNLDIAKSLAFAKDSLEAAERREIERMALEDAGLRKKMCRTSTSKRRVFQPTT